MVFAITASVVASAAAARVSTVDALLSYKGIAYSGARTHTVPCLSQSLSSDGRLARDSDLRPALLPGAARLPRDDLLVRPASERGRGDVTEMLEHTHKNTCCLCCRQLLASRRPLHPSGRTATIERSLSSGSSPSTSPSTSCTFAARSPSTALARAQRQILAAARPCKSTGDASARRVSSMRRRSAVRTPVRASRCVSVCAGPRRAGAELSNSILWNIS